MTELRNLEDIAITGPYSEYALPDETRVLRVFARRLGGIVVEVTEFPGGFSGNRTLKVDVRDRRNMLRASSVSKIGHLSSILDERERYRHIISPLLPPGAIVLENDIVEAGLGSTGGLFYQRAPSHEMTLADILFNDPLKAADVVGRLRGIVDRWVSEAIYEGFKIAEVRSWFLDDDTILQKIPNQIDWRSFEERVIQCRIGHQHGDLHSGNILVDDDGQPILIDFGRSQTNISIAVDPISLELSVLFHPWARGKTGDWPDTDNLNNWSDLDQFIVGCPVSDFIKACRAWSEEVSSTEREMLAVAYSYVARQLKYEDADIDTALIIINSIIGQFP